MTRRRLLDYLTRAALVGMAIFCGAARGGESDRTQAAPSALLWQVAEIDLTSSKTYTNPYGEVDVTVTFTGPRGESITRPTFWDGGSAWKVRFAPTAVGSWNWQTECSDQTNDGLNGRSGRLECLPAKGDNPCYRHGFLNVSDNRRHFVHADGTPFFWLGDTHWQMPDTERLDACNHPEHAGQTCPYGGQFRHLVADRRAKGFTVYQTYPSATNPAWWTTAYTAINPQRFREVFDVQMNHLAERGFVIALGFGHFNNSTRIPVDDLRRWARYLVARYGAHPVVWITCQEMNAPEDGGRNRINVWRAVAEEIQRNDGYGHPHSGHQWVLDARTRALGKELWHDWFALQGGHRGSRLTPQARYAEYFTLQPVKPVLETEAMYELVDCGGVADTDDARRSAWKALLCGCAGYTYGAAGVWALKWDPDDTRWSNYNHRIDGWCAGMDLPGSRQMTLLKRFFLDLPWHLLTPRFSDPAWAQFTDREESVLATCGQDLFVAYFYGPARSPGTLRNLDPGVSYRADWFDPRTGTWTQIDTDLRADNGQWKIPIRPDGDWVLVVRKRDHTATTQMVVAPSDDYPRNSEATLIVSNSGELLLFYGAHVGSGDWDRAVIRAVRSADGGGTWSEPITPLADPQRSLFQPSLTRLANGELGLTHTVLAHGQDAHKVFRRSADEGRTWFEPLKISDDSHAYTTGPHDRLYTLASGRLLAVLHCNLAPKKDRQGGPLGAYVVYSDDHGRTWTRMPGDRVLHVADNPYHKHEWGFWEPSLVEHEPGKLLMMARTATGWLYECRSADGGSTWTDPAQSAVPNPLAPPVLTQIPGTGTLVLLHNPRVDMESGWHGGPRTVLALRTSRDGGRSWSDPRPIAESGDDNDWYDYPAVRWKDDTLHVAYRAIVTRNRGQGGFRTVGIAYRTLTSAWIERVSPSAQGHER